MAERNCKKCFHYKACKEVASHSGYTDINYTESQCKNFICTDDVVEVVRCNNCVVPHNRQTGCPKLNGLITPPDFYCGCGERRKEDG